MWQDYILTIVLLVLGYALIPQVYRVFTLKSASQFSKQTCVLTAVSLWIGACVFFSLGLHFSGVANCTTAACWSLITYARYKYN